MVTKCQIQPLKFSLECVVIFFVCSDEAKGLQEARNGCVARTEPIQRGSQQVLFGGSADYLQQEKEDLDDVRVN